MAYKLFFESGSGSMWNPAEIGAMCAGELISHEIVKGGKKPYVCTTLVDKKTGEEFRFSSSKKGLEQLQTVPPGVKVRVTFTGLSTKKYNGNFMKFYRVETDGAFKPIKPLLSTKKSAKKSK